MTDDRPTAAPGWMTWTLRLAGVYNLIWGAAVIVAPVALFKLAGMDEPRYPSIWQCLGMVIGVYGIGYLAASRDPFRHWPIVLVGFLGKIFGPIGFVWTASRGELPWSFGWTIILNDLVWWVPFGAMLWGAFKHANSPPTTDSIGDLRSEMSRAVDQDGVSMLDCSSTPTLVVFLRHTGCTFCREALAELSGLRGRIDEAGVKIALVHMSSNAHAGALFDGYGLGDVPRFSDPDRRLYRAFELGQGSFFQLFGPRVFVRGLVASLRGHRPSGLQGDGFQMPGTFVIHEGRIVQAFRNTDASSRPDYAGMACEMPVT